MSYKLKQSGAEVQKAIDYALEVPELSGAIADETEERKTGEAVLTARMNTFTVLPEGSTAGDAEIYDARIGYTGYTWENVGGHIRGIAKHVTEEITTAQEPLAFDNSVIGSINANDGTDIAATNRIRTGQIYCTAKYPISITCNSTGKWLVHFFNGDTWLGKTNFSSDGCANVVQLFSNPNSVTHIRIVLAYVSDVDVADIADLVNQFSITTTVPTFTAKDITARKNIEEISGTAFVHKTLTSGDFEIGSIHITNGEDGLGENRIRTEQVFCTAEHPVSIVCGASVKWLVHFFNGDTWLGKTNFSSDDCENVTTLCETPDILTHVKILLGYVSDATVTDIADLLSNFTITTIVPTFTAKDITARKNIEEINLDLYGTEFTQETMTEDSFEVGGIFGSGGLEGTDANGASNSHRIRTEKVYCTKKRPISINCNSTVKWLVHFFNDETWIGKTSMVSEDCEDIVQLYENPNEVTHVRILLGYVSDATVTDIADILSNFTITRYVGEEPVIATREWVEELLGGIENGTY